jgi:hypothetical protein
VCGGITRPSSHRKFAIQIQDVKGQFHQDINVLDSEKICGGLPTINKGPWLDKLKERDIRLNDIGEESLPIEMLIGADWYTSVITGEMIDLENGLTAIETRFGWTVGWSLISSDEDYEYPKETENAQLKIQTMTNLRLPMST